MRPLRNDYINIRSIFPYITIPRSEWDEDLAIEYAAQAYDMALGLKSFSYEPKVTLLEVSNHKAKLPQGFRLIEMVVYMYDQPTEDEVKGFEETTEITTQITENPVTDIDYTFNQDHIDRIQNQGIVNNYNLYTGLYNYMSTYNHFVVLRPIDDPFTRHRHCTWCPNLDSTCDDTYTITKSGEIITSFESGYICVSYLSEPVDDNGDLLIINDADVQNALATYVMWRLWETKMHLHEENAIRISMMYLDRWEKLAKKIKGKINIKTLDSVALSSYQHRFRNLIKNLSNWNGNRGILE